MKKLSLIVLEILKRMTRGKVLFIIYYVCGKTYIGEKMKGLLCSNCKKIIKKDRDKNSEHVFL